MRNETVLQELVYRMKKAWSFPQNTDSDKELVTLQLSALWATKKVAIQQDKALIESARDGVKEKIARLEADPNADKLEILELHQLVLELWAEITRLEKLDGEDVLLYRQSSF
jgi:hypothetical protein